MVVVGDDDGRSGSMRPLPGYESLRVTAPRGTWEQVEQVWQSALSEYEAAHRDGEEHEKA
jgi:hypothetical protein